MPPRTLGEIPGRDAFSAPDDGVVLAHIYTSYGVPFDRFQKTYTDLLKVGGFKMDLKHPLWIAPLDLKDLEVPDIKFESFPGPHGDAVIYQEELRAPLPRSCFIYMSTPCRDGDVEITTAADTLEQMRGLFCLFLGRNFLHQRIISAEIPLNPAKERPLKKDFRICTQADGPYLYAESVIGLKEITRALARQEDAERARIESALYYYSLGIEEKHSFLFLWTALEILCGNRRHDYNTANNILKNLKAAYPDIKNVEQTLAFRHIRNLRDDWLHKGVIPATNHGVTRYIQVMFMDLLRHVLQLPRKDYLKNSLAARGIDLQTADGQLAELVEKDAPLPFRPATVAEITARYGVKEE